MKRPEQNVRPFLKVSRTSLKKGDLFYVRNAEGGGYRPRYFLELNEDRSYVYQSFMNNDIFADRYEATHIDSAFVLIPKPFALKIMTRAKELEQEVAAEFADVGIQDISRVSLEQQFEELADGLIGYDEYETIKQTVRRLGWANAAIVRRLSGSAGWAIDTDAFEYMLRSVCGETNTTVTPPVAANDEELEPKKVGLLQRILNKFPTR